VTDEFAMNTTYQRPGTYQVTYEITACAPVGTVRGKLTLVVTG
jgi:hypothetical protein